MMFKVSGLRNFLLYLYGFSINFDSYALPFIGTASKVFAVIFVLSCFPVVNRYLTIKRIKVFTLCMISLIVVIFLSSLVNINSTSIRVIDFSFALNVLLFVMIYNHERHNPGATLTALVFFAFGSFVYVALYLLNLGVESQGIRITVLGDNPNMIALRASVGLFVLFYIGYIKKYRFTFFQVSFLLVLIPAVILIFATGSRKAGLAFILSSTLYFFLPRVKLRLRIFYTLIALILSIGLFTNYYDEVLAFTTRIASTVDDGDMAGREEIWPLVFNYVFSDFNLIFGGGLSGYEEYSFKVFGEWKSPHNVLLEVLAYSGLIGLTLFLIAFSFVTRRAFVLFGAESNLLAVALVIHIIALMLSGQILYNKLVWLSFAYILARHSYRENVCKYPEKNHTNFNIESEK